MSSRNSLVLAALLAGAASAYETPVKTFGGAAAKPFGVLLLGEGGDRDWKTSVDSIRKDLSGKFPVEFAPGLADSKAMQKAIDALEQQRVKAIVAVPLFVSSFSDVMDENRYLLGIREKPSEGLLKAPHAHNASPPGRLKSKVPITLSKALDDHPVFIELLAARAQAQSRNPAKETIALIGESPRGKEASQEWLALITGLAETVRQKGGYKAAQALALPADAAPREREKAEAGVRKALLAMHRDGQVLVVPLELTSAGPRSRVRKALEGLFVRYTGRTILPDPKISKWVEDSATQTAKLPDMRVFKDGGSSAKTLARPPSLKAPGEKKQ